MSSGSLRVEERPSVSRRYSNLAVIEKFGSCLLFIIKNLIHLQDGCKTNLKIVVAHKIIDTNESDSGSLPDGISTGDLPLLSDGHEHWTSREEIEEFLNELQKDLKFSHSLTSDACYVDPKNPSECL